MNKPGAAMKIAHLLFGQIIQRQASEQASAICTTKYWYASALINTVRTGTQEGDDLSHTAGAVTEYCTSALNSFFV